MRFRLVKKYCEYCGKKLHLRNTADIKRRRFCSRSCCTKFTKPHLGHKHSEKTKEKMRIARGRQPRVWGKNCWNWKGGRTKQRGYVYVDAPGHPKGGYLHRVREHILVMEEYLKCYLEPGWVVHHKNGIKNDNRLENLELMSRSEHSKLHYKETLCRQSV